MGELTGICGALAEPEQALLERIQRGMAITADLSRADLLLVCPRNMDEVVAVAQAQPHSIASIYETSLVNKTLTRVDAPVILSAWHRRRHVRTQRDLIPTGTPIMQDVYPIHGSDGEVIALFSIETSLIQLERHQQRHTSFRRAIKWLQGMCMRGELADAAELSPFGEWDGIVLVDAQRRITYLNGIANNLYRKLGYMDDMRGKRLSSLGTRDDEMVVAALKARRPLEHQVEENQHIWIRKVLPVWPPATMPGRLQQLFSGQTRSGDVGGALILVHDDTEEQRKQQELDVKVTMIQEVHHRVKNNLQTIAALLRMQARRAESEATQHELQEAIARILSVAVIHEFLSLKETQSINIRDVGQRIVSQVRQIVTPGKQISLSVDGPAIHLASQQATACALVVNELIQNAMEHGFETQDQGHIRLTLIDGGDSVRLEVSDNGESLPADFSLDKPTSLGLQIVRTLVEGDLRGRVWLENRDGEVVATVEFERQTAPEHTTNT